MVCVLKRKRSADMGQSLSLMALLGCQRRKIWNDELKRASEDLVALEDKISVQHLRITSMQQDIEQKRKERYKAVDSFPFILALFTMIIITYSKLVQREERIRLHRMLVEMTAEESQWDAEERRLQAEENKENYEDEPEEIGTVEGDGRGCNASISVPVRVRHHHHRDGTVTVKPPRKSRSRRHHYSKKDMRADRGISSEEEELGVYKDDESSLESSSSLIGYKKFRPAPLTIPSSSSSGRGCAQLSLEQMPIRHWGRATNSSTPHSTSPTHQKPLSPVFSPSTGHLIKAWSGSWDGTSSHIFLSLSVWMCVRVCMCVCVCMCVYAKHSCMFACIHIFVIVYRNATQLLYQFFCTFEGDYSSDEEDNLNDRIEKSATPQFLQTVGSPEAKGYLNRSPTGVPMATSPSSRWEMSPKNAMLLLSPSSSSASGQSQRKDKLVANLTHEKEFDSCSSVELIGEGRGGGRRVGEGKEKKYQLCSTSVQTRSQSLLAPYSVPKHKPDIIWSSRLKRYIVPDFSVNKVCLH